MRGASRLDRVVFMLREIHRYPLQTLLDRTARKAKLHADTEWPVRQSPLRQDTDPVLAVLFEKGERLHHPTIEAVIRMAEHLASEMCAIFDPAQIAAGRQRRNFAIAFIAA